MKTNESARELFREQLGYYMHRRNVTQKEIADALGVSTATASDWASGKKYPRVDAMQALADFLEVSMSELVSHAEKGSFPKNPASAPKTKEVPLLGTIACGTPILAEENIEERIPVPEGIKCDFALICQGSSMEPTVYDGDYVYVKQQKSYHNGQIVAVLVDDSATLKRAYNQNGGVTLVADNPDFPPIVLRSDSHLLGVAVGFHRQINE